MRNVENQIGEFLERWHIHPMIAGATIVIGGLSLTLLAAGLIGLDVREVYGSIDRAVHYCLGDLIFWTVIGLLTSSIRASSTQRLNKGSAPPENDPGRIQRRVTRSISCREKRDVADRAAILLHLTLIAGQLAQLDAWIAKQNEPDMSRAEALCILAKALGRNDP